MLSITCVTTVRHIIKEICIFSNVFNYAHLIYDFNHKQSIINNYELFRG